MFKLFIYTVFKFIFEGLEFVKFYNMENVENMVQSFFLLKMLYIINTKQD